MTEVYNIKNKIKGEKPSSNYEIIRIRNTPNANIVLENFKNAILIFLQNKTINDEDLRWEKILPVGIINKLKQLDDTDYKYDELLDYIDITIYNLQTIKDWKWYSSLEVENGFDIVVEGEFNPGQFISFIHCQNVPLSNIKIINEIKEKIYDLKTLKDYTSYKTLK
ncbi:hypothetical protein [uncultured Dokdonia sp.]|uniref:hypothetical protein n=1 Tax=uncultured Dokdonia sp. TaxID=575653 RepID=UPI00262C2393|nr:hypothetical protein [uncultured Dokdonia sp.]